MLKKLTSCLTLFGASLTYGSIIPTLVSIVPDLANPGQFTWTYNVSLAPDQSVVAGGSAPGASTPAGPGIPSGTLNDYVTIFDFSGFTGVHSEPVGWGFQSFLLGSTPTDVLPADNASTPNLTWYRTGGTIIGPQASLGSFSANSIYNQITVDNFVSQGTRSSGPSAGTEISSIGTTEVPLTQVTTPEPGSFGLASVVLGLCFLLRSKLRQV